MSLLRRANGNKKEEDAPKINTGFTNPVSQIFTNAGAGMNDRNLIDGQKLINEWLAKKHLHMKTNLNQNQINSICILYSLAKQFRIKPLLDLINGFIMFMISKDSQSATQLVNILQSRGLIDDKELDVLTKFSK